MSAPDSFDSPDGRTYSAPETAGQAATPGQAGPAEGEVSNYRMTKTVKDKYGKLIEVGRTDTETVLIPPPGMGALFFDDAQHLQAAIAAAAPAPAGEAVLPKVHAHPQDEADKWLAEMWEEDDANAVGYHRSDMVDAYHAGWRRARELTADAIEREQPQAAPGPDADPRPASMLQPVSFSDDDDPGELRKLVPAEQLDHARAEAAGIRAAAANTARELAELAARWEAEAPTLMPEQDEAVRACAIELRKLLEDQ